ncbi:SRS domain-containing protein [Neospora caninum Liverpool]|uniref:SRS domain-containing protein n=1 Tax=Neospora caninum (strain Liverpool) TaxID=572307 RepID=F0VL88_NEOCL|nr:SRS domain-containing protein [Neospora caninum Liverpool]CBZ54840.1 SRS domain-containing protein [Neospora caninum Liverpool]CEL69559.1 TPA: SRS domain-containing protein [Neospora caninum Liverpool]|eukprot:XP_003884868.1 SRS domain-containing protein [Neospora caninum Liverpool]
MSRFCLCERVSHCCLAILLAGVLLKPVSFAVSPPPTQEPSPVPTCDKTHSERATLETELSLTVGPEQDSVSFKCSSTANAQREPEKENVYTDANCSQTTQLTTLFSGADLQEVGDNGQKTYTLNIPKNSRKATQQELYYKCTLEKELHHKNGNAVSETEGQVCKVKITVEAVNKDEPDPEQNDEQPAGPIECTGSDTMKEASVSAESPLSFKCGAGMSLHPTNLTDVFDDQDGKCAAEVALQTLVDATLTKTDAEATHNEQPVYQLAVKTAPSEDTALCYKCVPSSSSDTKREIQSGGESSAKECLLKIFVKGSASSAFSATWGAAQTAVAFFVAAQLLPGMVDA